MCCKKICIHDIHDIMESIYTFDKYQGECMKKKHLFLLGFLCGAFLLPFPRFVPKEAHLTALVSKTGRQIIDFVKETGEIPVSLSVLPQTFKNDFVYDFSNEMKSKLVYTVNGDNTVSLRIPLAKWTKWFGVDYTALQTIDLNPLLRGNEAVGIEE